MTEKPQKSDSSTAALWARFRFSVVGSLLSAPPVRGELQAALQALADKSWTHPVNGREIQFATATIERWYYLARREKDDPVRALRRAVRKDCRKSARRSPNNRGAWKRQQFAEIRTNRQRLDEIKLRQQ